MCIRDSLQGDVDGDGVDNTDNAIYSGLNGGAVYGYEAVSYTHLDVYKRQPEIYAGCAERGNPDMAIFHYTIKLVGRSKGCLLYTSRCV